MAKLSKKNLKILFEDIVSQVGGECSQGNPFVFQKEKFKCHIFIKNISPAYFKNYPDNSRVQLPTSNRFEKIIESNLDFLILGYDSENGVFVAWNPLRIKKRLNEKRNVSVYSRFSWQKAVSVGEFIERRLANEEKVVLFRKELLNKYFDCYNMLFDISTTEYKNNLKKGDYNPESNQLWLSVDLLLEENRVLEAVSLLQNELKDNPSYVEFTFKDFFEIVSNRYINFNS